MATAQRTDNYYSFDADQRLPYHTPVFSSSWVEAAQVPSLVAPSSPDEEGQISPCSFSDDPMLGYPWQQLPPSPSSHLWSPKTDDEEYVPHPIKLKPESLYPSPLLPPSSGILSTQDILDIDSPLLESLLVKDTFPSQPPEPRQLDPTTQNDQDDNVSSELDWWLSEDDEDEEETYGDVFAAWPATLSHTNSFSTENNEESEYDDDEDDDMVQHPWNRLLADLRDQIGKPIKEHDFMQLKQHVKETLEQCDDGAFPEIRECILDCVNVLESHLEPEDEDDDDEEEVPHRRRGTRCRRLVVESSASDEDDDEEEEEDDWTPEDDEEDVSIAASYERRPRRSSNTSTSSASSSSYRGLSKKTRKNYSRETTRVLMNWYLKHGGKTPEPEHKDILAKQANKSHVQISTWFQNARRRHHPKLIQYQKLHKEYPDEVYDYDSLIAFTERSDRRKRAAPDTDDEYESEAGSSASPKRARR